MLWEFATTRTFSPHCIQNRLISVISVTDDLFNFLVAASHLWFLSREFLTSPHAAAASQMESAVMKLATEIRSRDRGYAQQGGDWFTKQTVGYIM